MYDEWMESRTEKLLHFTVTLPFKTREKKTRTPDRGTAKSKTNDIQS